MHISAIKNQGTGSFARFHFNGKNKNIESSGLNLPNSSDYDYLPLSINPDKALRLKKEYSDKISDACFDDNGKLNPVIKKKLDESHFVFELEDGTPQVMTIKEALKSCVLSSRPVDMQVFHATFTKETAQNIIDKGFDPMRISRTEFGPGFYFAPSEGDAMNYGSAQLSVRLKGNMAIMDHGKYYQKIANSAVINSVRDFTGLKSTGYPTSEIEARSAEKIVNEYARNVLTEELGYDCAYGAGGGKNCLVAFNPKAISDVKLF